MKLYACVPPLLGLFMFYCRRDPGFPATTAEIEARGRKWVRQADGRLIEYFTCGEALRHPNLLPAWLRKHWQIHLRYARLVLVRRTSLGLVIFSPTQPGFGLSSSYPLDKARVLAEWPAGIALILEQEKVEYFYVGGWSAGCVHALTIANAYTDRILGVGLSTPTTLLGVELATSGAMALSTKFVRKVFLYPYWGDLLGFLMSLMDGRGRMAAAPDVAAALDKMEAKGSAGEEIWRKHLSAFVGDQSRGMVKGFRGWADNMAILNEFMPWDTRKLAAKLTNAGKSIVVTSAKDDSTSPPVMQEWCIDQLPGAKLMHCRVGWRHLHPVDTGVSLELLRRTTGKSPNSDFQGA